MTRNRTSETTPVRRSAIALAAALATVALSAAGATGQEALLQPEPVEPPIVEPSGSGPAAIDEQTGATIDVAPSQDSIAGLDNQYLRGIAADRQFAGSVERSAAHDDLGCVAGPSRSITIC